MIRNSYKVFSSSKFPKFQVVKFNPNGYNSAMRLNLFSNTNAKRDALYNSIILPTFDNKFSYSNFTYKYFNLKWKKFEQKANYNKYVKTPATFPNFLVTNNYFTNAFLKRRRKRRVYKRRRIRYSVIFKNRFLRSTKSTFRAYRLHPFYPAEKVRKLRKKLLRTLARKKSFKRLVSKYWVRRHWPGYYRRIRQSHGYKYYKRHKKLQRIRRRFYFKRRSYKLRVFRFFKYKRISKKLRYARRYAYRSIRRFKRLYRRKLKFKKFKNFKNNYLKKQSFSKIFKFQFFKRLARRAIKRRYFFLYLRKKLKYRIRARIFLNKFGIFRFLGFRDHLLQNYFNYTLRYPTQKSKKPGLFRLQHLPLFGYLFSYPQKILYSKNAFYFKLFTVYNILKTNKLTRFRNHFNLNVKQYRNFYTLFRDFFSIISVFKFNFIPFRFKLFKKNCQPFLFSLSSVIARAIGIISSLPDFIVPKYNVPFTTLLRCEASIDITGRT